MAAEGNVATAFAVLWRPLASLALWKKGLVKERMHIHRCDLFCQKTLIMNPPFSLCTALYIVTPQRYNKVEDNGKEEAVLSLHLWVCVKYYRWRHTRKHYPLLWERKVMRVRREGTQVVQEVKAERGEGSKCIKRDRISVYQSPLNKHETILTRMNQ